MKILKKIALSALLSFGLIGQSYAAECIAPANPGGGWDFTCRSISKIMTDIGAHDGSIKVTNMAGGGGGLYSNQSHPVNQGRLRPALLDSNPHAEGFQPMPIQQMFDRPDHEQLQG